MRHIISPNEELPVRKLWYGFADSDFDLCGNSWELSGSPYLSKVGKKFGTFSLALNGSSFLKSSGFTFGGSYGDFYQQNYVLEGFFTPASLANQAVCLISDSSRTGFFIIDGSFALVVNSSTKKYTAVSPVLGQSFYFRLRYASVAVNGIRQYLSINDNSEIYFTGIEFPASNNYNIFLGANESGGQLASGFLDEFRFKYFPAGSTLPTQPASQYTKDSNTFALLHFD